MVQIMCEEFDTSTLTVSKSHIIEQAAVLSFYINGRNNVKIKIVIIVSHTAVRCFR